VRDVALEVPLVALALAGLLQRHDARPARVEVLHEPADGAALAGGVTPLEEDDEPVAGVLRPVLQLEQLDLQEPLDPVVLLPAHALVVRVGLPPRVDRAAVRADEHRIVVVVVHHPQPLPVEQGRLSVVDHLGGRAGRVLVLAGNHGLPLPLVRRGTRYVRTRSRPRPARRRR
jgi:hypothetical protein